MKNTTAHNLVQNRIRDGNKRIEEWWQQINDMKSDIEKLNRWINAEQNDLDDAIKMLEQIEERERRYERIA